MDNIFKLNQRASLVELEPGRVFLEYGTKHFAAKEVVPLEILTGRVPLGFAQTMITAADVVTACMTERFGDVQNWPKLAHDFVM